MELSAALRERLWPARDWWTRFDELEGSILEHANAEVRGHWGYELAALAEYLVPDSMRAIRLYQTAWNATRTQPRALQRIHQLCLQMCRLAPAAMAAERELEHTGRPESAAFAGTAWLDSGEFDRAVPLLRRAAAALPNHQSTELALAAAERRWSDPQRETDELAARAQTLAARDASHLLLQAARVWAAAGDVERADRSLREAVARDPSFGYAGTLLERRLRLTNDRHALAELYQARAAAAASDTARVQAYRAAGQSFVESGERELGRAFLAKALAVAYERGVEHPPGHLAAIRVLWNSCDGDRDVRGVAELCAWGASTALPGDDRVALSVFAGPMSLERLDNRAHAARHAKTLRELAPQHPVGLELSRSLAMAPGQHDEAWETQNDPIEDSGFIMDAVEDRAAELRRRQRDLMQSRSVTRGGDGDDALLSQAVTAEAARERALQWARSLFEAMSRRLEFLQTEQREKKRRQAEEAAARAAAEVANRAAEEQRRLEKAAEHERVREWVSDELGSAINALADELMSEAASAVVADEPPTPQAEEVHELADDAIEILDVPPPPARRRRPESLRPEDREGDRIPVNAHESPRPRSQVSFSLASGETVRGALRDVSVSGAFVETDYDLTVDTTLSLTVGLTADDEWDVSTYVVKARVARVEAGVGFGAEFLETPAGFAPAVAALKALIT